MITQETFKIMTGKKTPLKRYQFSKYRVSIRECRRRNMPTVPEIIDAIPTAVYCAMKNPRADAQQDSPLGKPWHCKSQVDRKTGQWQHWTQRYINYLHGLVQEYSRYQLTGIKHVSDNALKVFRHLFELGPYTPMICYCERHEMCHTIILRALQARIIHTYYTIMEKPHDQRPTSTNPNAFYNVALVHFQPTVNGSAWTKEKSASILESWSLISAEMLSKRKAKRKSDQMKLDRAASASVHRTRTKHAPTIATIKASTNPAVNIETEPVHPQQWEQTKFSHANDLAWSKYSPQDHPVRDNGSLTKKRAETHTRLYPPPPPNWNDVIEIYRNNDPGKDATTEEETLQGFYGKPETDPQGYQIIEDDPQ